MLAMGALLGFVPAESLPALRDVFRKLSAAILGKYSQNSNAHLQPQNFFLLGICMDQNTSESGGLLLQVN